MKTRKKGRSGTRGKRATAAPYPFEFRLKVVRLFLEEGYSALVLSQEFGISQYSVHRWAKRYREDGEANSSCLP